MPLAARAARTSPCGFVVVVAEDREAALRETAQRLERAGERAGRARHFPW